VKNQDELKHDLEFSNQELNVLEAELCLGKNFTSKKSFLEVVRLGHRGRLLEGFKLMEEIIDSFLTEWQERYPKS